MLYSYTHMATVGVKGLTSLQTVHNFPRTAEKRQNARTARHLFSHQNSFPH